MSGKSGATNTSHLSSSLSNYATQENERVFLVRNQPTGPARSDWQLELLALHDLGVVDVEEVTVEDGLDDAGNDGDVVGGVVGLGEVAVDPVGDVQSSVASQGE